MTLFLFHIGPLSYFIILKDYVESNQLGYILYTISKKKKDIAKYLPIEFIKSEIKRFWEIELLPLLSHNIINDKQSYFRVYNIIKTKYMLDRNKILQKIGKIMHSSNISINRIMRNELPPEKFFIFKRFGLLGN